MRVCVANGCFLMASELLCLQNNAGEQQGVNKFWKHNWFYLIIEVLKREFQPCQNVNIHYSWAARSQRDANPESRAKHRSTDDGDIFL